MKADYIFRNAAIYTCDKKNPKATALVVKDGKFVYVGGEAGDLSAGIGSGNDNAVCGNILISGGTDYKRIGKVTIGGKEGPVIESPFVYQPSRYIAR